MKVLWFTPLILVAMTLSAQEPLITAETPVNSSVLHLWLHSSDPRLIAWAADFARRTHDAKTVAEMPELLQHWTVPPIFGTDESQAAHRRAVAAVLDTLIQENVQSPIPAIEAVAEFFSGAGDHPDWAPSIVRIAWNSGGLDLRGDGNVEWTHPGTYGIDDAGKGSGTEPQLGLEPHRPWIRGQRGRGLRGGVADHDRLRQNRA